MEIFHSSSSLFYRVVKQIMNVPPYFAVQLEILLIFPLTLKMMLTSDILFLMFPLTCIYFSNSCLLCSAVKKFVKVPAYFAECIDTSDIPVILWSIFHIWQPFASFQIGLREGRGERERFRIMHTSSVTSTCMRYWITFEDMNMWYNWWKLPFDEKSYDLYITRLKHLLKLEKLWFRMSAIVHTIWEINVIVKIFYVNVNVKIFYIRQAFGFL